MSVRVCVRVRVCVCVRVASSPDSLALVLSGARRTIPGARESGIMPPTSCHIFFLNAH